MSDPTFTKIQSDGNSRRDSRHPEEPRKGDEGSQRFFGLRPQNDIRVAEILSRGILYQALSFFFRRPDPTRDHSWLKDNSYIWQEAVGTLSRGDPHRLRRLFDDFLTRLENTTAEAWANEYERLLGHTVNGMAPPYELEYGEEHTHREPQQLADITAFYSAFGLGLSNRSHERADHATVELEFMSFLLYKDAVALEDGEEEKAQICEEASRRFLSEHLGYWFPAFAHRLSKRSEGLLKGIADFAFDFVIQDCLAQSIAPGPEDLPIRAIQERIEASCVSCKFARPAV